MYCKYTSASLTTLFLATFCFLLVSCAVGPDYKPLSNQELNIPLKWHAKLPHNGSNLQMINWWSQFNDPLLITFIESAIATNPSLKQSVAKIAEAQASLKGSKAPFYPSITANSSANAQNNTFSGVTIGGATSSNEQDFISLATGGGSTYTLGATTSWELDLFGGIRRNVEMFQARLDASKANWNDVRISLVSQVADAYVSARACQSLLIIYESQVNSRTATQKLTVLKVKSGFAPISDSKQGAGLVAQTQSNIEDQKGTCQQYINQLVALSGIPYPQIEAKMAESYALIPLPKTASISAIPAVVLSQRPDISAAERDVAAALANIGVATANRYPSLSLTGSIAANGGTLYASQPNSWAFGPEITLPLFDGGYLRSQQSLARAQYDEAVATYKSKVLIAVNEIENALVQINAAKNRVKASKVAVDNYQKYFNAMNKKYQIGWMSLLELETARINLISYEQNLTLAKQEEVKAWIALYKAVGGDWQIPKKITSIPSAGKTT